MTCSLPPLLLLGALGLLPLPLRVVVAAKERDTDRDGPWCPLFHYIYQRTMYDPSAPIRLNDGTWHMFPDGCGGWCHYSSPDLFHWAQHAPLPKLGGLTGSLSYTDKGMFLLHPKGGDWIARSVPNGTDAAKLDDFDDSSCKISGSGKNATAAHCAATAPNHGNGWPVGLDGNFMDTSRAVLLSDGYWYIVCGAGCMGACQSPRDDGKVGVPWFRATDSTLVDFELAGYLLNVTSSMGRLSSNQWSNETLPCHFQACPDVFPLGDDPELYVVISSVYPVRSFAEHSLMISNLHPTSSTFSWKTQHQPCSAATGLDERVVDRTYRAWAWPFRCHSVHPDRRCARSVGLWRGLCCKNGCGQRSRPAKKHAPGYV